MDLAEECSHALVCVLGCLGLSSQQAKFKLTPTTVYYLSLFWPVVDVAGDTLFLLTELMTVEMTKKLEKGPVPPAALACVAAASILFSLCLILWRFSYIHKMEEVGFDLTPKDDLFEEDDEPGVGISTRNFSVARTVIILQNQRVFQFTVTVSFAFGFAGKRAPSDTQQDEYNDRVSHKKCAAA